MHPALEILGLVVVVGIVAGGSERLGWSAPLLLVISGIALSFIPTLPKFELEPDVVLIGLLPPLLYAAAIRTSLVDFRSNRQALGLLSVGLVAFTSVVVGYAAWLVIPGLSLAAGFAIGAVVAPPDAVAATAVARRVGMPRRLVTILEGESLVNDATALVTLNTAIAAMSHSVGVGTIGWDFVRSVGGGLIVGLVAATVLAKIRKHIREPVLDTTLSFAAPYIAFLPAQEIHGSGVLAVVITGLILGHKAPVLQTASSRLAENTNWRTIQFLLENVVFLLIGLELRQLIKGVHDSGTSIGVIVAGCASVLVTTLVARIVWVYAGAAVYRCGPRRMRAVAWTWPGATVIGWAGMRGVVTLAAVLLLPADTPHRDLLRLCAFVVVAGTLVVQGTSLPWLVRRLRLRGPDPAEDALQAAALVNDAAKAGLERLDQIRLPEHPEGTIQALRERAERRSNAAWERLGRSQDELEPPEATYRRLRMEMLDAERGVVLAARNSGTVDDAVLRTALAALDVEESLLDRVEDAQATLDEELRAPRQRAGDCAHLRDAPTVVKPLTPGACEDCLREGTTWVHLRMCLTCGHVGCCDSSVGRHATRHFHETAHPVMRSVEPGEAWRWCYVDELLG
ncbi:MAG: Na+/H+ antiporter [Actinobacteria bacterium]|nr:Na+/H+ antiporter [Actinomycetota bacterium]